jgi:TolB-like protein
MGEVYRARDTRLGRDVAVKVLPTRFTTDRERLTRFEREARAIAALDHPNVLVVLDAGEHEGVPYLVTTLLAGSNLRERMRGGALPLEQAAAIAVQVADGLAAAHEKGIVHRDLKPENVFVSPDGHVTVLDFGLAKLVEGSDRGPADLATTVTTAGEVIGTVPYLAPEQARGLTVGTPADVFAFGCVLYEMLAGQRPFSGGNAAEVLAAILTRAPRPLEELARGIPAALGAVVSRCLEKSPDARFPSARETGEALRAALHAASPAPSQRPGAAGAGDRRPSVAVLPFTNLSADPEQAYFCDGMAEEVINALAHVEGLRVIARTSAFVFRGLGVDAREIGDRLDVGALLEGGVRKAGDRLRITVQLVDTRDGASLWSERYDRRLEDVFAIQEEIALAVVSALEVRLLGRERAAIARRLPHDLDAYSAYLQGIYHWGLFTPEGFSRSRQSYEEAIRLDPRCAPALCGLALWYVAQAFWSDFPPKEARDAADTLVERALAVEPERWDAHTLRGVLLSYFDRQWEEGEPSLRRGVALGPGQAAAHFNLAGHLVSRRCHREAADEARVSIRLDPMSPTSCSWSALWLNTAGCHDEAGAEAARIAAIAPGHWLPRWVLSNVEASKGNLDRARAEAETAVALSGGSWNAIVVLACMCAASGDLRRTDELEGELLARSRRTYVSPIAFAFIADARGDGAGAARWIERAAAAFDPTLAVYRTVPEGLRRGGAEVEAALEKLGL